MMSPEARPDSASEHGRGTRRHIAVCNVKRVRLRRDGAEHTVPAAESLTSIGIRETNQQLAVIMASSARSCCCALP